MASPRDRDRSLTCPRTARSCISEPVQAADSQLAWIDRSGRTVTPFSAAGAYSRVALSDDGRYLAFERNFDVMLFDIARNATSNLIVRDGADIAPVFSP